MGERKEGRENLRVLVVDDEKPCLDELVYLLLQESNVEIVGAYTSSPEALKDMVNLTFDLAFLDLSMPHIDGVELARKMQARYPSLKVVFVTAYAKELGKLKINPSQSSILKPVNKTKIHQLITSLKES